MSGCRSARWSPRASSGPLTFRSQEYFLRCTTRPLADADDPARQGDCGSTRHSARTCHAQPGHLIDRVYVVRVQGQPNCMHQHSRANTERTRRSIPLPQRLRRAVLTTRGTWPRPKIEIVDTGELGKPGWARDLVEDSLFANFGVVLDQHQLRPGRDDTRTNSPGIGAIGRRSSQLHRHIPFRVPTLRCTGINDDDRTTTACGRTVIVFSI